MTELTKLDWILSVHTTPSLRNTPVLLAVFDDSINLEEFVRQNKFSLIYFNSSANYDEIETEFGRETADVLFKGDTNQEKMIFGILGGREIARFRKEHKIKQVACYCTGFRMKELLEGMERIGKAMEHLSPKAL